MKVSLQVIVVEDSAALAFLVEEALTSADHLIVGSTGSEGKAVGLVLRQSPDLVLRDIRLHRSNINPGSQRIISGKYAIKPRAANWIRMKGTTPLYMSTVLISGGVIPLR